MVCAIGDETGKIFEQISIPTITPEETVPKMVEYFKKANVEALGIACFGPIDPDKSSPTYGHITSTPKLPWQNYNIVKAFEDALGCPAGFDTDVNGSVLGGSDLRTGKREKVRCLRNHRNRSGCGRFH